MPLNDNELREVQNRIYNMLMGTINVFEIFRDRASELFIQGSDDMIRDAVDEFLRDFIETPESLGLSDPETTIFQTEKRVFELAGLYGAQLALKERQVTNANRRIKERIQDFVSSGSRKGFKRIFLQWIDTINNFLGSLVGAVPAAEALKELKDCIRDDMPDDDDDITEDD